MKLVIISDIKGKTPSIIPYGLNLARTMQCEADIVHVVDTRVNQGVATPYADSHTVTPAEKLSFDEILNKEKEEARDALDKIISLEGSRLNYPLKINLSIDQTSIINKLVGDFSGNPLVLVNKDPDGQIFLSRKEMIDVARDFNGFTLFVPPCIEPTRFEHALLPVGFSENERKAYRKISHFTGYFHPFINAVVITGKNETAPENWKSQTAALFEPSNVNCHILPGNDYDETLILYAQKIRPDLILLAEQPKTFIKTIFKKDLIEKILDQTNIPVLFCPS